MKLEYFWMNLLIAFGQLWFRPLAIFVFHLWSWTCSRLFPRRSESLGWKWRKCPTRRKVCDPTYSEQSELIVVPHCLPLQNMKLTSYYIALTLPCRRRTFPRLIIICKSTSVGSVGSNWNKTHVADSWEANQRQF